MKKWGKRKSPSSDAFDALNLNPLDLYKVRMIADPGKPVDLCLPTVNLEKKGQASANVGCYSGTELFRDVRVRVASGSYQTPIANRPTTCQPAEGCESDSESYGARADAVCSPAP